MTTKNLLRPVLISIVLLTSLSACSQMAITTQPDVEFQDVSLSLSTVNVEDYLHHFEYDRDQPLDIHEIQSWREFGVTVTELTYASPRGEPVPTLLFEPDGEGPFAGLVLMHGAPGQKENFSDLGVRYARLGFVAIAIDAPQFRSEHNQGHVAMALIWPRFDEKDLEEQSQLILDLQRAVDLLLTLDTVDPERLAYIGGSYGGALGGLFCGIETRLKAYVLKVGDGGIIEHLSEPDEQGMPQHLPRWVDILWPIEPIHYVGRAAPAELLFQNGISDSYVPTSDTLRYFQAASEPKTITWYNADHFLPPRHYYDHLMWQHARVGVDSILLKPLFSASYLIYDRLLLAWFVLSALSLVCNAWFMRTRQSAGWLEILVWSLMIVVMGPVGLAARWLIKRSEESHDGPTPVTRALSAALWITTFTMLGVAIVLLTIFLTILEWNIKLYLFFVVPQFVAGIAQLIHRLAGRKVEGRPRLRASVVLPYAAITTLITTLAFVISDFLIRATVYFSLPVYHPLRWFVVMLTAIIALLLIFPLHLLLSRRRLPLWEMPIIPEEEFAEERPRHRWYLSLPAALGAYFVLFLIQAAYVTYYTPNYVKYFDAIKLMVGIE
jgi:dienelactone hydrolase